MNGVAFSRVRIESMVASLARWSVLVGVVLMLARTVTLQGVEVDWVAHRGASHDAPENTLAAFRLGWEQGADAIEGDFHLTADGEIVSIHDFDTERTTGRRVVVNESALHDLKGLEYGGWKGAAWTGEPIPTLGEVLATVPDGKYILVEIKCGPEITEALTKVIRESSLDAATQVRIIAFDAEVVAVCKRAMPEVRAYWLTGFKPDPNSGELSPSIDSILETLERIGADGLDCNAHESIDEAFVQRLRDADYEFHVWTVDDPDLARRFIALGVDSITTNRPGWLRETVEGP